MTTTVALHELVHFVDDENAEPLQKRADLAVRTAEHDVERFWRRQQHVRLSRRQAFDIADAYTQAQTQPLVQDRFEAAA